MAYVYANLKTPKNTGSGVADGVWLAPVSDFVEGGIKGPVAPFSSPGDEVVIKDNHEFKPGKKFVNFLLAPQKNQLSGATIGDLGFQKLDFELKIFMAGSYAEVHEAVKNILNTPLVVLIKDSNCAANMYYQLGSNCNYAWASFAFSTGTTVDGIKGYEGTIKYQGPGVYLYEGGINGGPGGGDVSNKFTAYWGWMEDTDPDPANDAAIEASANHAQFNKTELVSANFMANSAPKILWMAEPTTEPAKTVWYADILNTGSIGSGELFGAPTTIGSYRFYKTTYETSNTSNPIEFRVS